MNPSCVISHAIASSEVASFDLSALLDRVTEGEIGVGWLLIGLLAQMILFGCLVAQRIASKRRGKSILPASIIYVALIAMVMLLVYASVRHDLVFVIGQLINVIIALRLLEWVRKGDGKERVSESNNFPVVEPDSADRSGFFRKE